MIIVLISFWLRARYAFHVSARAPKCIGIVINNLLLHCWNTFASSQTLCIQQPSSALTFLPKFGLTVFLSISLFYCHSIHRRTSDDVCVKGQNIEKSKIYYMESFNTRYRIVGNLTLSGVFPCRVSFPIAVSSSFQLGTPNASSRCFSKKRIGKSLLGLTFCTNKLILLTFPLLK